ncbi:MAG TPA: hypothetical protein VET65_10130 [Candidatus Limnocylindrales bacterium]|nr:hypothetical protein [Candidatus Limnocylindrales bacterium]
MRDAVVAWLALVLLGGLLLPATTERADDQRSAVTVTFVEPATAAEPPTAPAAPR